MQQGIRKSLLEGIELALEVKFGKQGSLLMLAIQNIQDLTHLHAVKNAIKTARNIDDVITIIESDLTAS